MAGDEEQARVHYENPFVTPPELREPARQLRGAIASGVTIWTSGPPDARAGLTVSSVLIAEGEPSLVLGLLNDTTDLFEAISSTGRFVVHVLGADHRLLADRFAGLRPSPGGIFAGLDVDDGEWGPVLGPFGDRAYCRSLDATEAGYHRLVRGEIERIELAGLDAPLVYYRGRYRSFEERE